MELGGWGLEMGNGALRLELSPGNVLIRAQRSILKQEHRPSDVVVLRLHAGGESTIGISSDSDVCDFFGTEKKKLGPDRFRRRSQRHPVPDNDNTRNWWDSRNPTANGK